MPSLLSDMNASLKSLLVVCVDVKSALADSGFERRYFPCRGEGLDAAPTRGAVASKDLLTDAIFRANGTESITVIVYPTRTYSEGFGGALFSEIAPEDRSVIRGLKRRFPGKVETVKIPLAKTALFESLENYFSGPEQRSRFEAERDFVPDAGAEEKKRGEWAAFDGDYVRNMGSIFKSCMTRPNRQDYMWLATKTFTLNLAIRLFFVVASVKSGQLPLLRAVASTTWYQIQDAVFTVFGQTYMKFLGKMTPMVRIKNAAVGDFVFVYIQLCSMEFINRLVLGPLGENPLVYTLEGVGLIFFNVMQGMISGGPIIPAINKMRKVGAISHSTMMHLYQLASLTMHFGLFASFGFQKFYAILTGVVLVLAWGSYILFSTMFKDPEFVSLKDEESLRAIDGFAGRCASAGGGVA